MVYGKKIKIGNLLLKNYKMGFKKPTHGKMGRAGGVVIERNQRGQNDKISDRLIVKKTEGED